MITVRLENYNSIKKFLDFSFKSALKAIEKDAAVTTRKPIIDRTPTGEKRKGKSYRGHPGLAKRSWSKVKYNDPGYSFSSNSDYIRPLDKGSGVGKKPWPSAKKWTVEKEGKIFSSRVSDALGTGIIEPILTNEDFRNDIIKTMIRYIRKELKSARA